MLGQLHGLTVIVGLLAIVAIIVSQIQKTQRTQKYNFEIVSMPIFIFKIVFFIALIGALTYVLAAYNGLSWTIVIVALIAGAYAFVMNKTRTGRYIYGMGGNREAAALSGVNVRRAHWCLYIYGLHGCLGGILYTSRLGAVTPTAGNGFELDAIASGYIAGVSTTGGIGSVISSVVGCVCHHVSDQRPEPDRCRHFLSVCYQGHHLYLRCRT